MGNLKKKPSSRGFFTTLIGHLRAFCRSTEAHGFKYIADSSTNFERMIWAVVIVAAFSTSVTMIAKSYKETTTNPISTVIDLASATDVPFPLITVDGGDVINPWGFAEKVFDQVLFESYGVPFETDNTSMVRSHFSYIMSGLVARLNAAIDLDLLNDTLDKTKELKKITTMANQFSDFDKAAAMLAIVQEKSMNVTAEVYKSIANKAAETIAKFTPINESGKKFGSQVFMPIVEEACKTLNITLNDYKQCMTNVSSCPGGYKMAYVRLLQPFLLNLYPYQNLTFGHLMSFFVPRLAVSGVYLSSKSGNTKTDLALEKDLIDLAEKIFGQTDLGISVFELAKFVDRPHSPNLLSPIAQVSMAQSRYNCTLSNPSSYMTAWRAYLNNNSVEYRYGVNKVPCTDQALADSRNFNGCCSLAKRVGGAYAAILKIMKYSQQVPHFRQSRTEYDMDFSNLSDLLPYPLVTDWIMKQKTYNPRIFMCQFNKRPVDMIPSECDLFVRSFTNVGIGYSFNGGKFMDRYRDTASNNIFRDVMNTMEEKLLPEEREIGTLFDSDPLEKLVYPEATGPSAGLNLVIQSNSYVSTAVSLSGRAHFPYFRVAIDDPLGPGDLRHGGIELEPGYSHTFHITPSQMLSSPDLMDVDRKKRNCKFRSENEGMVLFKEYTQKGCVFECQLHQAWERCQCIPWDYPRIIEESPVCDFMGAYCFDGVMSNTSLSKTCDCLHDCNTNRYSYSVSSTALDMERICKRRSATGDIFGTSEFTRPNMFMRNYLKYVEKKDPDAVLSCKEVLKETAFVQFYLASQDATQIKRDIRVTMADYVSNIGGTIGLFTGMSIIGLFELVFWLLKIFIAGNSTMTIV